MKWSLVLSGGGARGLAYIGMFKAFKELGYPNPDHIVGCSIGSIIGGLYASGMKIKEMENFFLNGFTVGEYIDVFKHGIGNNKISKILQVGTGLNNLLNKNGIDDGKKTYTLLKKLFCYQKFENLDIPFSCNATELCTGKEIIIDNGFLADAAMASSSYPVCFSPFENKDKLFVDGCVKNNTPVWIATEKGYKNILAVTLGRFREKTNTELDSIFTTLLRIMEVAASQTKIRKENIPTHILNIESETKAYDFSQTKKEIDLGYKITMRNKQKLDSFFDTGFFGNLKRHKMKKQTEEWLKNERIF